MIPEFPYFSPINIGHKTEFKKFVSNFEPYSDFNFTSLFSWNVDGSTEISFLNGNLVIKMPDYIDGSLVYSILGRHKMDESLDILLGITDSLKLVPAIVVRSINSKYRYMIHEDRDNHDYMYELDSMARLNGQTYKKKRNKLNDVLRDLEGQWSSETITDLTIAHKKSIKDLFELWTNRNTQSAEELKAERIALNKLLDNWEDLDLLATILKVREEVVGFSINEILDTNYSIAHFEKAIPVHDNIYLLLTNLAAKSLASHGCSYVNWEQDLGLDGLRRSKMSYHPVSLLNKYTVSLVN